MIGKAGNFGLIPYKQGQTRTPETADRSPPNPRQPNKRPALTSPPLLPPARPLQTPASAGSSSRLQIAGQTEQWGGSDGRRAADGGGNKRISIATAKQTDTNKSHPGPRIPLTCRPQRVFLCVFCMSQQRLSRLPRITNEGNKRQEKKKTRPERE